MSADKGRASLWRSSQTKKVEGLRIVISTSCLMSTAFGNTPQTTSSEASISAPLELKELDNRSFKDNCRRC